MGFRENLRDAIDNSGLVVKELAAQSGVSMSTINNYLTKNAALPSVEIAVKLARAPGVSAEYLVFGSECPEREDREIAAILRLVKTLPTKKKKYVIEALKTIIMYDT